jgi:hypothetical protein
MYVYTYTCVEFDPKRTVFSHYLVFYLSLSLLFQGVLYPDCLNVMKRTP